MIPQAVLDRIKEREGLRDKAYADSLGIATAGWGHRLSPSECHVYSIGTTIPGVTLEMWFEQDVAIAYAAALRQAGQIKFDNPILTNALTSVCFQLGAVWPVKFPVLWKLLLAHEWEEAAKDVEGTLWAQQTPVRAKDFTDALSSLSDVPLVDSPQNKEL